VTWIKAECRQTGKLQRIRCGVAGLQTGSPRTPLQAG